MLAEEGVTMAGNGSAVVEPFHPAHLTVIDPRLTGIPAAPILTAGCAPSARQGSANSSDDSEKMLRDANRQLATECATAQQAYTHNLPNSMEWSYNPNEDYDDDL